MHLFDLSNTHILIHIKGEKAETFLQGQITCDVKEISETTSRLSAHCNPKGRILSSFRVFKYAGDFYLYAPHDNAEQIIKQFKPYAQFSKVTLEIDTQLSVLGICGEDASEILKTNFQTFPQSTDEMITENSLCLIRLHGATPQCIIIGDKSSIGLLKDTHEEKMIDDIQKWSLLEIQAGVATIHPETSALFTPQMLNYPELKAVSFKKGCYIGQEVIARTHYLGKAKRNLHRGNIASALAPTAGDLLLDIAGNEVGVIVNSALNIDMGSYEFLAVIQDKALDEKIYFNDKTIQL